MLENHHLMNKLLQSPAFDKESYNVQIFHAATYNCNDNTDKHHKPIKSKKEQDPWELSQMIKNYVNQENKLNPVSNLRKSKMGCS